MFQEKTCLKTP